MSGTFRALLVSQNGTRLEQGAVVNSRMGWITLMAVAALAGAPAPAEGQTPPPVRSLAPMSKKEPARVTVPQSHLPPAGMCRIWIANVPPAQQPAPTDCASAIRNRPSNGRVIFPEDGARSRRDEKPGKDDRDEKGRKRRKPIE